MESGINIFHRRSSEYHWFDIEAAICVNTRVAFNLPAAICQD